MKRTSDIIAGRKARWRALYDRSRPSEHLFIIHLDAELGERPWPRPDNAVQRIEWAWRKYETQLARLAWLDDDAIPFLDVYTGTDIFAAAFGCPVHHPEDNMPFALPLIESVDEIASIAEPELTAAPVRLLFEIAEELRRRAGPDAILRLVDVQSPMDISALILEKGAFYRGLIEAPDQIERLATVVRRFLTCFLDEWFRRFGPDFIAHYPDYYMPNGLTLSEDEVGSVKRSSFERLFLPELKELAARYGALGMHCCANARHQWEGFRRIPGLRMLNFVQPPEVTVEAIHYFADHVAQMHACGGDGSAWTWPAQVPAPARMVFDLTADTREEALDLAQRMRVACEQEGRVS